VRQDLGACARCGLLVCKECRGERACAVCYFERLAAERRMARRERMAEIGRRAAVIGLVAASGATGLGAALLPDGPLCAASAAPKAVEIKLPAGVDEMPGPPVEPRSADWGDALAYRCFDAGNGVTCCVVVPK
jgi:hypothetical protein